MFCFLIAVVAVIVIYLVHHRFNYWQRLGFPQEKMTFGQKVKKLVSFNFPTLREYEKFKQNGVFGCYYGAQPVFMVTDPIIISHITIRERNKFYNRKADIDRVNDPIAFNLFAMHDND